jgi:MFS family permease
LDQAVAQDTRPPVVVPRRRLVLAAALIAIFMPAVESSIVATALPTIVGELGGFHLFSWVFAVPLLTMAVTIPLYGRLADLYGRKRIFFIGTAIFLTGTTLCGFARSMEVLVLFRALQGIGAGAIQPIAQTIIGDIYAPTERARIQGASSAVWGFAAIVGPALSVFLVEHVHWSVVFWVNLPVGAISIAMFALFLDERVERREHRIDYLGGVLLIIGIGALMLALVQAVSLAGGASLVGEEPGERHHADRHQCRDLAAGCWRSATSPGSARRRPIWRSARCCRPMSKARWGAAPALPASWSARRRSAGCSPRSPPAG